MKMVLEVTLEEMINFFANNISEGIGILAESIECCDEQSVKRWCVHCEVGSLDLIDALKQLKQGDNLPLREFISSNFYDCIPYGDKFRDKEINLDLVVDCGSLKIHFSAEEIAKIL